VAATNSTTLQFTSLDNNWWGPALDHISVSAVTAHLDHALIV
jgi:hypothetical protein